MAIPHVFSVQIELSLDLEIEEPEDIIFNNLEDIATDSKNNIYILDSKEKTIYLFNEEGKLLRKIGGPGQGPGEFQTPVSIYVDNKDFFYIMDVSNGRIEIFNSESNYVKSIRIMEPNASRKRRSIVDKKGNFYISGYYPDSNSVISKFSSSGELIKHFPLPAIEYKGIEFNEHHKRMAMQNLSGGSMCFDEEERIYFSYSWPYLIKILTKEGDELFQLSEESNFNWVPFIFKTDRINGTMWGESTRTYNIFLLNNQYIVNSIFVVDWKGNPRKEIKMSVFKNEPEKYIKMNRRFAALARLSPI